MASSLDEDEDVDTSSDPDFVGDLLPLSTSDFDSIDRQLDADYIKTSKEWYAATGGQVGDVEPEDLAVEELSLRPGGSAGKKSKKPAFYDIAFNYVTAFDMEAVAQRAGLRGEVSEEKEVKEDVKMVEAPTEAKAAPAKSGWGFGLFGRK
jgi:signal recognition particle subunit SRP68